MADKLKGRGYFENAKVARAFEQSFIEAFALIQREQVTRLISSENVQRLRHGTAWGSPANKHAIGGEMQTHSMIMETSYQDLVENKLELVVTSLNTLAKSADQQFSHMVYAGVSSACEQTGNTVDAKALGLPEAFAQMLEKVEFAVDRDGKVAMPEMHVGPEAGEKLIKALNEAPPEFSERIEGIKAKKSEEALAREAERKNKFARYGG